MTTVVCVNTFKNAVDDHKGQRDTDKRGKTEKTEMMS